LTQLLSSVASILEYADILILDDTWSDINQNHTYFRIIMTKETSEGW